HPTHASSYFSDSGHPPALHSFPTRRSSDLDASSVITAVRGRTGPDVYFMDRFNTSQFASLGLLEPIDDLIEEYEGVSPKEYMSGDRKSTRLNSSHVSISYAVFCLKKKKTQL